jgi:hypothetical protein
MFLDNPLGVLRRDVLIPRPFRINHADRPGRANPQTGAFRSITRTFRPGNVQLLHPFLHVFPGLLAGFRIGAIRSQTDEEMPAELPHAKFGRHHRRREMFGIRHDASL